MLGGFTFQIDFYKGRKWFLLLSLHSNLSSEIHPVIYPKISSDNLSFSQKLFLVFFSSFLIQSQPYLLQITIGTMGDALVEVKDNELKLLGIRVESLMFKEAKFHVSLPPSFFSPIFPYFPSLHPFLSFTFFNIKTT